MLSGAPISAVPISALDGESGAALHLAPLTLSGYQVPRGDLHLAPLTLSGAGELTGVRATALTRRALVAVSPDIRATSLRRKVLLAVQPDLRATALMRRALVSLEVGVNLTGVVRRALVAQVPCATRWTRIWIIRRQDGTVHRLTSLDRDLDYAGQTYASCGALAPSASEASNVAGEFATMQLGGAIAAGAITLADLDAGRLDGARFEEWEVPWDGTPETPKLVQRGQWGRVEFTEEGGYDVEVRGDGALLQQAPLVQVYAPLCRWSDNIRDPRCGVDVAALTVTGTVEAGLGQRSFLDSARSEAAGYFAFGLVTFTSGLNAGVAAEIRGNQDGVFTLWPRLSSPVAAGDGYSMIPGCDQTKPTCQDTFNNYINFGGFADVPGEDALHQTPTAH